MIDVFVCTNEVNYCVAAAFQQLRPKPALLLFDPIRIERRPIAWTWQVAFGRHTDRYLRVLHRLGLMDTAYVPHRKFDPKLLRATDLAKRHALLDDGLDTWRLRPKNLDPGTWTATRSPLEYLSFTEYRDLPAWLDSLVVRRVCSLRDLAVRSRKPPIELKGIEHVFVESPGLQVGEIIKRLQLDPGRCLCVRHPVPAKRGELPPSCRRVDGRDHSLEASLLMSQSRHWYFGATMSLVFALHCGVSHHNVLLIQLGAEHAQELRLAMRLENVDSVSGPGALCRVWPIDGKCQPSKENA